MNYVEIFIFLLLRRHLIKREFHEKRDYQFKATEYKSQVKRYALTQVSNRIRYPFLMLYTRVVSSYHVTR